jgi:plastocyanin
MRICKLTAGIIAAAVFISFPAFADSLKNKADNAMNKVENLVPKKVDIVVTDKKFIPNKIMVEPGRKVVVTLVNDGTTKHNIQFDLPDNRMTKIDRDLEPGQTGKVEFTVSGPGEFQFTSPVGVDGVMGLKGQLTVKEGAK